MLLNFEIYWKPFDGENPPSASTYLVPREITYRIVAGINTCIFMWDPFLPGLQGHVFLSETLFISYRTLNKTSV